jgi:hypothetical protein
VVPGRRQPENQVEPEVVNLLRQHAVRMSWYQPLQILKCLLCKYRHFKN